MKSYRPYVVAFLFVVNMLGTGPCLLAQDTPQTATFVPGFYRGRGFPSFWESYSPPMVAEPSMTNSERLHSLMSDGKLHLSVEDTIALALENNLDIAISRFQPAYAQTDLLRAKSGGAPRGVSGAFSSSALFAGALGGGLSSSSSGSSVAAGGSSGGGAIDVGANACCDPFAGAFFSWDQATTPLNYLAVTGAARYVTQTSSVTPYFGQGFLTGTSYTIYFTGYRQSANSTDTLFNPEVPTGMAFGVYQHLLNGFGRRANAKYIRIAQNDVHIAESVFRQQVITTVAQVLNLYWDYLSFQEQVAVAQHALTYSEKQLADNKRQVEIGTLAPIDVVRAESEVATDQQNLIVAQTNVQQQAELIKTALAKKVDGDLVNAQVEAMDKLPEPRPDDIPPLDEALEQAVKNRPEIEQADLNLRYQSIVIKANRNALLPTLDLFATYAPTGLSGVSPIYGTCPAGSTAAECVTGYKSGGIAQSLSQVFHDNYPNYSVGLSLQIPLRNRSAQADTARALLEQRQLVQQLQRQKNQVEQDVRSADVAVIQAKARIEAARKAVILNRQTLDAEQKKFQLGESTVFLVIQAQRDLATAEGNEVQARSTYAKALTQFQQATGTVLSSYHIELNDALQGKVARVPNIPGSAETPAPVKLN